MTRVVLDTNIMLRLAEPGNASHAATAAAVERLRFADRHAVLLPQVVYEFWAVATRTTVANGPGMSAVKADAMIEEITRQIPVMRDERCVYDHWRRFAKTYAVTGVNSYDMRIVAAMLRHGIQTLLTANARDFTRYSEIEVLTPEAVLAG